MWDAKSEVLWDVNSPKAAEWQHLSCRSILVTLEEVIPTLEEVILSPIVIPFRQLPLDWRSSHDRCGAPHQHTAEVKISTIPWPLPHREHVDP